MFEGQQGLGVPQGLARFCSGPVWAEATLLTSLYNAACSRCPHGCVVESSKGECVPQRDTQQARAACRASQEDLQEGWQCRLFLVHPQESYLADISERLTTAGVAHDCVRGSLDDTGAISEAARSLGIPDFEGHLWLGSVLETLFLMRHERARGRASSAAAREEDSVSLAEVCVCCADP